MRHRIGFDESIELYESKDLNYLSKLATDIREAKNGNAVVIATIDTNGIDHLKGVMTHLGSINGIISVTRI